MHPTVLFGAAVLGVVAAIGYAIYNKRRQHAYQNNTTRHDEPSGRRSGNERNLTCPFCGLRIGSGDPQLDCGHLCHGSCFFGASDRRCKFCAANLNDVAENINHDIETRRAGFRRRLSSARSSANSHTTQAVRKSETLRDDVASSTRLKSHSQEQAAASENTKFECSYCAIPAKLDEVVRMPCLHVAHSECFKTYKDIMRCINCAVDELPID